LESKIAKEDSDFQDVNGIFFEKVLEAPNPKGKEEIWEEVFLANHVYLLIALFLDCMEWAMTQMYDGP